MNMENRFLILNSDYSPISISTMAKAVGLFFLGKVEMVGDDFVEIKTIKGIYKITSVLRLKEYKYAKSKRFGCSHKNIFLRDGYKCCYCLSTRNLTIDHIIPKSEGGKNTWENLVSCCHKCNARKGNKMLYETNMILRIKPYKPNVADIIRASFFYKEKWEYFLAPFVTKI